MNISTEVDSAHVGGSLERRRTSRFPVHEDVRYKIVQSKIEKVSGAGTTLNIGSSGILFTTEERLPLGRMVELSVNWPARLDGTCALQFVATGVWYVGSTRAAVRIERYEFRHGATGRPRWSSESRRAAGLHLVAVVSGENAGRTAILRPLRFGRTVANPLAFA
jgi:hypothetical protein